MLKLIALLPLIALAGDPRALIFCIFFHEAGHILCALTASHALPTLSFTVSGFRLHYTDLAATHEKLLVALCGPVTNILMWAILPHDSITAIYSIFLALANLLPMRGLDGGEIVRCISAHFLGEASAERILGSLSTVFTLIIFALNCAVQLKYEFNLSLMIITIYFTIQLIGR